MGGGRDSVLKGGRETQSTFSAMTNHMAAGAVILDENATPKPRQVRSKRRTINDEGEEVEVSQSPSKRSKSTTSGASRSSSPTKPNVLRSLQQPIRTESIDSAMLPEGASGLVRQLRRFAAGFETVPQEVWRKIVEQYPDDFELTQNVTYETESDRARLGDGLSLKMIDCVCRQAQGCQKRNENEAAWNTHVDGLLLSLTCEMSIHRSSIGSTNVTTAQLNPRFKPTLDIAQAPLPGKVVDFVFFLEPSDITRKQFGSLPWEPSHGRDFNHTLHGPIADRPIVISMETKREGEGRATARAQLHIWVASHFNRLRELAGDNEAELPLLPLLLTQGPICSFSLAQHRLENGIWTTTIFEEIALGDLMRPSGVCKVFSSLLWLVNRAQLEYRPWFERILERRGQTN